MSWDFENDPLRDRANWPTVIAPCSVCGIVRELNRAILICPPCQRDAFDIEEALAPPTCICSDEWRKEDGYGSPFVHAPYCPLRSRAA